MAEDEDRELVVTLSVHTRDREVVPRVVESLTRIATGFALDGSDVHVGIHTYDDEDETEEEPAGADDAP